MKRFLMAAVSIVTCFLMITSCASKKRETFPTGNLKYANDMKVSKMSDYQKDGFRIYETYADNYVFSFVVDLSGVQDYTGSIWFEDENGKSKRFDASPLGVKRFVINFPNYELSDKFVANCSNGTTKVDIKDFFPGITASEEKKYSADSTFIYNDKEYTVTDIVTTPGFCILSFDKEKADPQGFRMEVFDDKLKNKSNYFIYDYKMYLTDFLNAQNHIYFKMKDNPNLFTIKIGT